jgi:hypothetical protein
VAKQLIIHGLGATLFSHNQPHSAGKAIRAQFLES